ncbi:hypothetical protein [Natronobacterium texcoconense]|nr:hypothetical protein [Natronobacterium texcoconense]
MTTDVECDDCERVLPAFESVTPSPIEADECPDCGGTSFSFRER